MSFALRFNTDSSRKPSRLIHKGWWCHTHSLDPLNSMLSSPAPPLAGQVGLAWASAPLAVGSPRTLAQRCPREGPCGHRRYCAQLGTSHRKA